MIRAFVALLPPPDIRSRLTVLQFLLPLPRRVETADLHLTLAFLGEVPDAVLSGLDEGLSRLRMAPFDIDLSGVGLFGGARPRSAWAGVAASEPLARLQAKVEHLARQAGARIEARRFVPHVTLGRFAPPDPDDRLRLEGAVVTEARFLAGPWRVEEGMLMRSWGAGEGPRYQVLETYPLG
ncbi:MAG TPA: RNA 2',3'-cyclic phosphodiesterase [Paracoccaceae bacterium]|nr:RNA 2',3'-cyclic phosphodiesterase [Paracoccaceae bacterium]